MNIVCLKELPFALLEPGLPLRIEVKGAIYFGPINQQTSGTALPRIELGLKIAAEYDGYWIRDEKGRVRRIASLEHNSAIIFNDAHIEVFIDLRTKEFGEVRELYQQMNRLRFELKQQVLS